MSAINQLREGLAHTETAQFVTTMLRDISATKLQSIRAAFEANEKYFTELHGLMGLLQTYAAEKNIVVPKAQKQKVLVALTSNRRFYGSLNTDVIVRLHAEVARTSNCECYVIGQTGRQIIERMPIAVPVTYAAFDKDEPTAEEIHDIVTALQPYAEIVVVHPTYINAFQQEATVTDVTHVPTTTPQTNAPVLEYLFEPDVPGMLNFFNVQIRFVLFDRIVLATRLALTGARLMKMQRARERAEEMLVGQRRVIHKEISTMQSMRLLETFTGFHNDNAL